MLRQVQESEGRHAPGGDAADVVWQATLDSLDAQVAVLDERGTIIAVNRPWREFFEREKPAVDWLGSDYIANCERAGDPAVQRVAHGLREMLAGRQDRLELEYACHSPTERRWFRFRATRLTGCGPVRVVVAHEPTTPLRLAEEQVSLHTALVDEIDVAVILVDENQTVLSWNAGAEELYGYARDEAVGAHLPTLVLPDEREAIALDALTPDHGPVRVRRTLRRRDGTTFAAHTHVSMISAGEAGPRFVGVSFDVSERDAAERALVRARNYLGALTDYMGDGLYTLDAQGRVMYMNHAARELLGWSPDEIRGGQNHDIIHGHTSGGDHRPVAQCPIHRALAEHEVVRVDDDAFIRRDGTVLPVSYTAAPFETEDGAEGCVIVFQDIRDRKAHSDRVRQDLEKLTWVGRVQEALREERFVLYAQPIVDVHTGAVVQRELLIRMRSRPDAGDGDVIGPGQFLPVAEEYGLITEIDRWVVDRAAEIAATGTTVELNVSARSICDRSFTEHVRRALVRTGARPEALVFELTETALVTDEAAARRFLERLHAVGCGIALDDFGTGYGGFTYLKQLPIDALKIDIEFVRDLVYNAASRNVVEAVVGLARGFGLKTIAEGVEDAETLELLRDLGVNYAQGFHLGRPAPLKVSCDKCDQE